MSVRAHRVIKIEWAKPESFNLWHDDDLVDFLDKELGLYEILNEDNTGLVEIPTDILEKAIKEVSMADNTKSSLQEDIEAAKKAGDSYVTYYCF